MKKLFLEARSTKKITLPEKELQKLPEKIALFATVQYIGQINSIKKQLEKAGRQVTLLKPKHAKYKGQLLGCSIETFSGIDGFLFIGDGLFHPLALTIKNSLPVFTYNPRSKLFGIISEQMKKKFAQLRNAGLKKFLSSDNIGILVSTKSGQAKLKEAMMLSKRWKKQTYILVANDIDFEMLENFTFIDCIVNTACPRISYDDYKRIGKPIVDMNDIIAVA